MSCHPGSNAGAGASGRTNPQLPHTFWCFPTWQRHYERRDAGEAGERLVRFKANRELPKASEGLESPYDVEARYRHKRDTQWTGYMVHVTETCEPAEPHLLTHIHTTSAAVHEAKCTVEGTLSQGVRAFGMRRSRYRGLAKTHLQNLAIASAINLDRLVAWLDGRPRALTRTSRLAMLAPSCATGPG